MVAARQVARVNVTSSAVTMCCMYATNDFYSDSFLSLQMKDKTNVDSVNGAVSAATIRARYVPKVKVNADLPVLVAGIAVGSFVFNVVLALLVIWAVIRKMQADAEAKLERGLAKIILYAGATWPGSIKIDPRFKALNKRSAVGPNKNCNNDNKGDDTYTVPPPLAHHFSAELPPDEEDPPVSASPELNLLVPSPRLADAIVSHLDKENDLGVKDGETDKNEFIEWARKVSLDPTEINLVWKELDKNKSGKVDKKEWDCFLRKRKKLKWLIGTMKSVRKVQRSNLATR